MQLILGLIRLVVPALMLLALWLAAAMPVARVRLANWSARRLFLSAFCWRRWPAHTRTAASNGIVKAASDNSATAAAKDNWEFFWPRCLRPVCAVYRYFYPENVHKLKVAPDYHTGRRLIGPAIGVDENTCRCKLAIRSIPVRRSTW